MVTPSVVDLRVFQWGKESTRGTLVPATSKLLVADVDFEEDGQVFHPPLVRGLVQRWKGGEIVVQRGTKFTIPESVAFYEQMPNWLSQSVKGAVAPTGVGPYVYTYTRDPTANPLLDSWTYERRLSDGTNFIDQEFGYAMLSSINWKSQQNQPVMFTAEGFARRQQTSTLTASLSAPATPEALLGSSSKLYIDTTWAGVGGTIVSGQIVSWDLAFNTGYMPIHLADGRSDLDFAGAVYGSENTYLTLKAQMLVKPNSGQYATEKTAAEAQTLRAVQIRCDGSTANLQVKFNMLVKHNMAGLIKIGEFEAQDLVEMELVESTDATNFFQVIVTNNIAAIV